MNSNKEGGTIGEAATVVDKEVEKVIKQTDKVIEPYRKSAFHRFPTLFTLLVTFGVVSIFFGFERIIMEIAWLDKRPFLILGMGILALVATGTLHKKL